MGRLVVVVVVGEVEFAREAVLKDGEQLVVGNGAVCGGGVVGGGAGVKFLQVQEELTEVDGLGQDDGVEGGVWAGVPRLAERCYKLVVFGNAPSVGWRLVRV